MEEVLLNSVDFKVRLQRANCCFANKAYQLGIDNSLGIDCHDSIRKVALLEAFINIIKCYQTTSIAVSAIGKIKIALVGGSPTISTIVVNGVNILSGVVTGVSNDISGTIDALVTNINSNTSIPDYTAYREGIDILVIKALPSAGSTPNGYIVLGTVSQVSPQWIQDMNGGVTAAPYTKEELNKINCLTVDQINDIFEYISKECCLCFAPPGFEYSLPQPLIQKKHFINKENGSGFFLRENGNNYIIHE